jgi:hypothetical protein
MIFILLLVTYLDIICAREQEPAEQNAVSGRKPGPTFSLAGCRGYQLKTPDRSGGHRPTVICAFPADA